MTLHQPAICPGCGGVLPSGWAALSCPRCLVRISVEAQEKGQMFPPGEVPLLGDHELLDEIARGGMGVVFRARQRRLGRIVAVKVLAGGEFAGVEARRRFRTEAEAAARLQHPGIVAIHDIGESDGLPWLSMDFVAGENLASVVREQPLPARQAAEYVRAIAEAVQHAHDHGVLHRDLKPSNVLLDEETGPRITDFGIARCVDASEHTRTGEVLGSPGYTAPEQALGGTADARTDVYGLGALLYHLLTARPPFQGPTLDAILLQLREADPLAPRRLNPAVPRDLETICLRCLRKDPANRYVTAREMAEDLARFQRGETIHARPISALARTWRWCRRRPAIAALLALLVVVTALAFVTVERARREEAGAKGHAEAASAQLRETNARLEESLDRIELDRAEDLFRSGDSAGALAPLARIVRRNPLHPIATARLASALWHGSFALPLVPPMNSGAEVTRLQFLRDGSTLLVCTTKGASTWNAEAGRRLLEFERAEGYFLAASSPDERTLVEWDPNPGKAFHFLDIATGRRLAPPIPHEGWIHTVVFSPDSSLIVIAASDAAVQIRDARTGEPAGAPLEHESGVWSAAFSPDGATIATGTNKTVRFWDSRTRQLRTESLPLEGREAKVRFSPEGRWLVASTNDGAARLLSVADGHFTGLPMRHEDMIRSTAFSPDGRWLVTASEDHTARVWSVPGGEPTGPPLRHRDRVSFVTFSPDSTRVVTCAMDHTARVWDAHTGRPLTQSLRYFEQPLAAAFTTDGARLYAAGSDGFVQRWDLSRIGKEGESLPGTGAAFSADGSRLVVAARRDFARETATLQPLRTTEFADGVKLARLSPDGRRAAIIAENGSVSIVPLDDAARAETVTVHNGGQATDLCFSADGTQLAIASDDRTASLWDTTTGQPVMPPLLHEAPVVSVRISPDGGSLLTVTRSPPGRTRLRDVAQLWNRVTGERTGGALEHIDDVRVAEFSPDGALVVTASGGNTAHVWDAHTGTLISRLRRHARTVAAVAFSPDSRRVVTGSWDGTARVWDAHSGALLARTLPHEDRVTDVQFSPNGRRIATASRDKSVRLWDAGSGQPLTEPLRHPAAVEQVRFAPDGQHLLTSMREAWQIREVPEFPAPLPGWLLPMAETVSLTELPDEPDAVLALIARYEQARAEALGSNGDTAFARLARRLFAPKPAKP